MGQQHPNAGIAERLWTAIADGDAGALREVLSVDVHWKSIGRNPMSGDYRGVDGVLEYLARVGEAADDLRTEMKGVFANDEGVVILHHATAARGVRRLDLDYLLLLRVRDGRVYEALSVPVDQPANDAFWL